jgi:hypothetical protein
MCVRKNYVIQSMEQVSKFEYLTDYDPYEVYLDQKQKKIIDIDFDKLLKSNNKRYIVVAEPGYGKTRLLKEIVIKHNKKALFIDAKKITDLSIEKSLNRCKYIEFDNLSQEQLQKKSKFKNFKEDLDLKTIDIVCIDALDEVAIEKLSELFETIEDFISDNSHIKLFLSCRTHHMKKINFDFEELEFKFITLNRFSYTQIKTFIEYVTQKKIDLNELIKNSKMSDIMEFISVPRYLYYFTEMLKDSSLEEVVKLPRKDMFEHFIYRKLEKELQTEHESKRDSLKRVLENIALIMKINGVSEITKDELTTIFEKIDSNLFQENLLEKLYDRSLLKVNVETVEFENQEFLDYLAAKELSRFQKVEQVFFDLAIEPHILEIYPSWFYVLPFLLEFKPEMIGIYIDFIKNNFHRELKIDYFQALISIEPDNLSKEVKSKIFDLIFDYHSNHNKWLVHLVRPLALFYDKSKYRKILDSINEEKYEEEALLIHRVNAISLVSILIEHKLLEEKLIDFWKRQIEVWIKLDTIKNQVLHEEIASSISSISCGDFEWIKSLYPLFRDGVQTQDEYARACFKISPNEKFSIDVYLNTDKFFHKNKSDDSLIRVNYEYEYILKLSSVDAIKYAFEKIFENENQLSSFCEFFEEPFFGKEKRETFQAYLQQIYNNELSTLLKELILKLLEKNFDYDYSYKRLYELFSGIILEKDSTYLKKLLKNIKNLYGDYYWESIIYIYPLITIDNFNEMVEYLDIFEENKKNILIGLYYQDIDSEIKLKLKRLYPEKLDTREKDGIKDENQFGFCKKWEEKIEPEPNKFSTDLFRYFDENESLKDCPNYEKNLEKMIKLAKEILQNNNPLNGKIKQHDNDSLTVWKVPYYYYDCIEFVYSQKVPIEQSIKDNVFRYLPFNINNDYEKILAVADNPSSEAIQDIVDVYAGKREDDLGIVDIRQFIELYSKMKLEEFEPILLNMLKNEKISESDKWSIVQALPKNILSVDIIKENRKHLEKYSSLDQAYLIKLLIHKDNDAIEEAFEWTKRRAKEMRNRSLINGLDEWENIISFQLAHIEYDMKKDKELLLFSSELSTKGKETGAKFCQKVVKSHLEFLIKKRKENSFEVIKEIEDFLEKNRDKDYLHWFEYSLSELKEVYLKQVHEQDIENSIKRYNELKEKEYSDISTVEDLLKIVKEILDNDIRSWIEDEGAYKHIQELAKKGMNTNAEEFIQKTIKPPIESALLKRGFRETDYKITREEQLLDDKRLDFTIFYGFIGSVMIELKLSHNPEAIAGRKAGKDYVKKLKKYLNGSNSKYGIFAIFNVKDTKEEFEKKLNALSKLYKVENNISIIGLDCINV